ncbi:MarR family winged helix-turn-helix transcriptional regulator [Corynebacterium heidelbergense]|uniref:MarR family transcriptional regulator n=1 Tax=Corynebacterium heidelbergense TaxID=2055947 RepID=A0A364V3Y1_9CORY|nr:MarR family transcriptional regulator [Corynebacterium heidelbergense]RAV31331.1 MarR family transcriptional regulator [Corynebacterium heidelbergense]
MAPQSTNSSDARSDDPAPGQTSTSGGSSPSTRNEVLDLASTLRSAMRSGVHMIRLMDEGFELTTSQLATLNSLREGPLNITLLTRLKAVSQPTMSQHVSRLEKLGYVERAVSPDDARITLITLTGEGRAIANHNDTARDRALAEVLQKLDAKDRRALQDGLEVLKRTAQEFISPRRDH